MKKLLLLLLCVPLIGFGQNKYHNDEVTSFNFHSDSLRYLKKDMSLLNGIVYDNYDNFQLASEYTYEEGKRNGISKEWFDNGQLWYEGNYKHGKQEGLIRNWYYNGQLTYEENMKDGKHDGLSKGWYRNGQLWYERNYKDGKLISKKCWDESGNEIDCK